MTFSSMMFSWKKFSRMTFSRMTFSRMTFSRMTFSRMTFTSMTVIWMTFNMKNSVELNLFKWHSAEHNSLSIKACSLWYLFILMSVIRQNVIQASAILLNVAAPLKPIYIMKQLTDHFLFSFINFFEQERQKNEAKKKTSSFPTFSNIFFF